MWESGQGHVAVTKRIAVRNAQRRRFDSGLSRQCSAGLGMTESHVQSGWVLGAPERSPPSCTASIAVATINQEAALLSGSREKTGNHAAIVQWQDTGFPSPERGFDSRSPLHGFAVQQASYGVEAVPERLGNEKPPTWVFGGFLGTTSRKNGGKSSPRCGSGNNAQWQCGSEQRMTPRTDGDACGGSSTAEHRPSKPGIRVRFPFAAP